MCEINVYKKENDKENLILKDVTRIIKQGDKWVIINIVGEKEELAAATLYELDMTEHKIVFK